MSDDIVSSEPIELYPSAPAKEPEKDMLDINFEELDRSVQTRLADDKENDEEPKPKLPVKRKKYKRDWHIYNLAKTQDFPMTMQLVDGVVDSLNIKTIARNRGRPPLQISDMLKCVLYKVKWKDPFRENTGKLDTAKNRRFINSVPHYNSIINYMGNPSITPFLREIHKRTVDLIAPLEIALSADATGISTSNHDKWVKVRLDFQKHHDYKKLHIICGNKTHGILSAVITEGTAADSPQLPELLDQLPEGMKIKMICADPGYLSRKNAEAIAIKGAEPIIKPKKNTRLKNRGSPVWGNMVRQWAKNKKVFMEKYGQRNNVESTFKAMKQKFEPYVKNKKDTAQINEILCKVILQNLSVILFNFFSLGIKPDFTR